MMSWIDSCSRLAPLRPTIPVPEAVIYRDGLPMGHDGTQECWLANVAFPMMILPPLLAVILHRLHNNTSLVQ